MVMKEVTMTCSADSARTVAHRAVRPAPSSQVQQQPVAAQGWARWRGTVREGGGTV